MVILGSICVDFLCIVWLGFLGSLLGFSKDFNGGLQRDFLVLKEIFFVAFSGRAFVGFWYCFYGFREGWIFLG